MVKGIKNAWKKSRNAAKVKAALVEFCDDIDQTGGLVLHGEGSHHVPAASDDWNPSRASMTARQV